MNILNLSNLPSLPFWILITVKSKPNILYSQEQEVWKQACLNSTSHILLAWPVSHLDQLKNLNAIN